MYYLTDYSENLIKNLIWITGPARSGTTILGKVISSTKNTEYFLEPELLFSLLPMIKKINFAEWNLIYRTYISEELLLNSVIGRKLNFRISDDSYINNSFTKKEIDYKLNNKLSSSTLKKFLTKNKTKIIIKIPDLVEDLLTIKKKFKKNKFISTDRNSFDILNSLITKNWFDQKNIKNNNFPLKVLKGFMYPFWLPDDYLQKWKSYNSEERSALYIILMKKKIKKLNPHFIVHYDDLLKDPEKTVLSLCDKLNLNLTKKTKTIIDTIDKKNLYKKKTNTKYNIRKELINTLKIMDEKLLTRMS